MVKLWLLKGLKKGILTTKYPKNPPTMDEIPSHSIPPSPQENSDWEKGSQICPTKAISLDQGGHEGTIDIGKCIYCQKCSQAGFVFQPKANSNGLNARIVPRDSIDSRTEGEVFTQYAREWRTFNKSLHIFMIDVGSCNACNFEVLNLSNPYYDLNRLGIFFTNSPKHADVLLVVGALNTAMVDVLKRTYDSIPFPKITIAVGACPISGGIFRNSKGFASPIGDLIPLDVAIPGCPPTPVQILQGLLIAMGKLEPIDPSRYLMNTGSNGPSYLQEEKRGH